MFVYTLNELLSYIVHLIMLKRHNMNTIKNLHYFSEGLSGADGTNGVFNQN